MAKSEWSERLNLNLTALKLKVIYLTLNGSMICRVIFIKVKDL